MDYGEDEVEGQEGKHEEVDGEEKERQGVEIVGGDGP